MVSIVNGKLSPLPFDTILDPTTKRTRVRTVDVASEPYQIARRYMIRLDQQDFEQDKELVRCAAVIGLTADAFRERFASVVMQGRTHTIGNPGC